MRQSERSSRFFLFALALGLLAGSGDASAVMNATTECLIGFDGDPEEFYATAQNGTAPGQVLSCEDCDPSCDTDPGTAANDQCTFSLKLCANRADGSCT